MAGKAAHYRTCAVLITAMTQNLDTSTLVVDFVGGVVGHRFRSGEGRGQALAKAVGFSHGTTPEIVDATAGLGGDAFLLASLGARVTLIERSPRMHDLSLPKDLIALVQREAGMLTRLRGCCCAMDNHASCCLN